MPKNQDVTVLCYTDLNTELLACNDVDTLQAWLADTVKTGSLYRSIRVHSRMNAVRRAQELADIKQQIEFHHKAVK